PTLPRANTAHRTPRRLPPYYLRRMVKKTKLASADLRPVERAMLSRIVAFLAPYRTQAALVLVAIAVSSVLSLTPALLVKRVVDDAIPQGDLALLFLLCVGMIIGPLLAGLVQVGQKYIATWIGERVMLDLRVGLFRHLHRQSIGWFTTLPPGEAVTHVLNDVKGAGDAVSSTLTGVAQNAIALASTLTLLVALDWRLTLVAIGALPLFVVPSRRVGHRRKELKREAQARIGELTGILTETLSVSGALLLKVFGGERREAERFEAKAAEAMALQLRQSLVGRWFELMIGLFESVGPALVFAVGGWLVITQGVGLGTVVAFVTVLKRLYGPAADLAGVHVDLITSYAYFDRIFRILDLTPTIVDAPDAQPLTHVRGEVEFHHVSFAYAGGGEVLHDFDLRVGPGQVVALVGASGAGKSTAAGLVPRLHDPTEGSVTLDGIDLRRIRLDDLRAQIGVVTQDVFLFHGSVVDNLRYGRPDATLDEVVDAARRAQVHDLIASLPEGYATIVGERGHRFSGGERQRLAIARVLLKRAPVLILDEATSSLDLVSENLLRKALEPLLGERTTLVIAHRLATVRRADLIVVLDRGRIVERGTHAELLALHGHYFRLHGETLIS
ncbi:MAG TPA: ABC transporter ATP-binding protein, partial [Gammaproteobacteria bacterium]